ncbi:hypothetical protein F5888DRAFT_1638736 [Russula emetica]|nr:hypothetical protein F5888DRAFT_1638736 [Russula emetica]
MHPDSPRVDLYPDLVGDVMQRTGQASGLRMAEKTNTNTLGYGNDDSPEESRHVVIGARRSKTVIAHDACIAYPPSYSKVGVLVAVSDSDFHATQALMMLIRRHFAQVTYCTHHITVQYTPSKPRRDAVRSPVPGPNLDRGQMSVYGPNTRQELTRRLGNGAESWFGARRGGRYLRNDLEHACKVEISYSILRFIILYMASNPESLYARYGLYFLANMVEGRERWESKNELIYSSKRKYKTSDDDQVQAVLFCADGLQAYYLAVESASDGTTFVLYMAPLGSQSLDSLTAPSWSPPLMTIRRPHLEASISADEPRCAKGFSVAQTSTRSRN